MSLKKQKKNILSGLEKEKTIIWKKRGKMTNL
jgi:hypothetical protein